MRAAGTLNDPAYRECRRDINAMIRLAPILSVFTFLRLFEVASSSDAHRQQQETLPPIAAARRTVFYRTFQFLFLESLTGLVVCMVAACFGLTELLKNLCLKVIERLFDSPEIQAIGRSFATRGRKIAT